MEWIIFLLQRLDFFSSRHPIIHRRRPLCRFRRILPEPLVRFYVAPQLLQLPQMLASSALFELYPIVVAAFMWGKEWSATSIIIHCDNEATVHCINKGRSRSLALMPLLRCLIWISARDQFIITAKHIPGSKNQIADSLSRFAFQKFRQLAPEAEPLPTPVPPYSELIFP